MRDPLLPITVAFAAGIASAPYFFLSASQQVFWLAISFLGALLLLRFGWYAYGLVLSLLGFFLCGTFLAAEEHSVLPPRHIESLARGGLFQPEEASRITGWAHNATVKLPGEEYLDLELTRVDQFGVSMPTQGRIRLYHFESRKEPGPLDIAYGTIVSLAVLNLRRPRNFMTAGFYDSEANMERQEVCFTGVVRRAEDVKILPGRRGNRWRAVLSRIREKFLSNLDRLYPPEQDSFGHGAILKAMLLGDNNWIKPETASAFQETGAYHLLVVSGLHVGALAFAVFWLLSWFRLPNWVETLLLSSSVIVFTFLANARLPAVRATLMVLLYLAARLVYRGRALLNSIAAAAIILLVIHPSDLRDSGFQFSFLAVLTIAAVAVPLVEWLITPYRLALQELDDRGRDRLLEPRQAQFRQDIRVLLEYLCDSTRRPKQRWQILRALLPKSAAGLMLIAEGAVAVFFIQVGLSVSMATFFHRVVWSGVTANLLVLPLISVLIPLGLLVLLVSVVWWPAAMGGSHLLGVLVTLVQRAVDWSAHVPRLDRRVPGPPIWFSMVFLVVLLLSAVLASRRSRWVALPLATLIPLAIILTLAPYPLQIVSRRLELTALDVGQGDSLFITFPGGHTMLVDGGGEIPIPGSPPSRFDVGERIVSPYLWSRYLKTIDFVVLTHAHWDHLGGLFNVLSNFRVGEFWIGPGPRDPALDHLLQLAASRGIAVIHQQSGNKRDIDGVEVLVLSPPGDWSPKRVSNNDSLVLRLGYGRRHILLSGDVEARMEQRLVSDDLPLASDILKVPHHGSKTSTSAPFLSRVGPRFGIISVGAYKRFGHPSEEVLEALARPGIHTYRTDGDGSITASTDGNRIEFAVFRDTLRPWPPFDLRPWPFSLF